MKEHGFDLGLASIEGAKLDEFLETLAHRGIDIELNPGNDPSFHRSQNILDLSPAPDDARISGKRDRNIKLSFYFEVQFSFKRYAGKIANMTRCLPIFFWN